MGMSPPTVLLDLTFLDAVADPDDANHDDAVAIYRTLIDGFLGQCLLLTARADHLADVNNADLFATVDKLHVARQHRNAANDLMRITPIDVDVALTLVLIHRYKVRRVATFDERLNHYDLDIIDSTSVSPTPVTAEDPAIN